MSPQATPQGVGWKGLVSLTGATGFIGGNLARRLADSGWRVRALVRSLPKGRALEQIGVDLFQGDLDDAEALTAFLRGADAVVHCAGTVRGIEFADFAHTNVSGTERIATLAARQDPPPRFLSLSSLAAREPQLSPYAASKRAGETVLEGIGGPMPVTILRPPAVYGPGDREMLPLLLLMMRGVAPVLGASDARFSLLYVDDLTAAIERCLSAGEISRGPFELHDGRVGGYTWDAAVEIVTRLRGKPVRMLRVPRRLLQGLAVLSSGWGKLTGMAPMLTPAKVRELTHPDWVCDNTGINRALGWSPQVAFAEGLQRTLDHHQAAKRGMRR